MLSLCRCVWDLLTLHKWAFSLAVIRILLHFLGHFSVVTILRRGMSSSHPHLLPLFQAVIPLHRKCMTSELLGEQLQAVVFCLWTCRSKKIKFDLSSKHKFQNWSVKLINKVQSTEHYFHFRVDFCWRHQLQLSDSLDRCLHVGTNLDRH